MTHPTLDAVIEGMARAHDQEDAAQKGEISPWTLDAEADPDFEDFRSERIAAMKEALRSPALQAVLREGASALQNALPHLPTAGSDYVKGAAALAKLRALIEK